MAEIADKKNKNILSLILGTLILICIFLCIFISFSQRIGGIIQPKEIQSEEVQQEYKSQDMYGGQVQQYEKELSDIIIENKQSASLYPGDVKEETAGITGDNDYLCPYSSERLITEKDIQQLKAGSYDGFPEGKGIIRMVINEMYAKYGYQFTNEEIMSYFNQKDWYRNIHEKLDNMDPIYEKMTEIEKKNIEILLQYDE